jgi:hypothetical protein
LVEGAGPVDGVPELLSSTRTELFGYGVVIGFLFHFCRFHRLEDCTLKLVTLIDNRAAIKRAQQTQWKNAKRRRMCNDADTISIIVERLEELNLRSRLSWVKAHQDEKKQYAELDIAGRMNCDADGLTTNFRLRMEDGEVEPIQAGYRVEESDVTISIGGMRIQGHYSHKKVRNTETIFRRSTSGPTKSGTASIEEP